jgi:predicted 3-demethylubiquinone-9 3-methyltransferase (glyoxalase superfamily)
MTSIAKITPHLWFDRQALEAAEFYCSVFPDSRVLNVTTLHDTPSGLVDVVDFELSGQFFQAISAGPLFKFNEAVSFVVRCDSQEEIDHFWGKLSAVPEAEACGWLKDRFGLSWQIVPRAMDTMLRCGDAARAARVTQAFLAMKKFDLAALQAAFESRI